MLLLLDSSMISRSGLAGQSEKQKNIRLDISWKGARPQDAEQHGLQTRTIGHDSQRNNPTGVVCSTSQWASLI